MRWATARKASLFGLGIPPAQYDALVTSGDGTMASVLRARLEKLACDFPLDDNYFAWQAFGRRYPDAGEAALPPISSSAQLRDVRGQCRPRRRPPRQSSPNSSRGKAGRLGRPLRAARRAGLDDATTSSTRCGREITRTAAPGARVIFRTAAEPSAAARPRLRRAARPLALSTPRRRASSSRARPLGDLWRLPPLC